MQQIVRGSIILLISCVTIASSNGPQQLDRVIGSDRPIDVASPPSEKLVASRVAIISHLMGIPVGIEEATEPLEPRPRSAVDLAGMTVRAALDQLVAEDPRYQWREMKGVIVVRPASSWNDCAHFLNRRVSVTRGDLTMTTALSLLFTLIDPEGPENKNPVDGSSETFQLDIRDAPILDVFNEIARARRISWQISSTPPVGRHRAPMSVTLRAPDGHRAGLSRDVAPLPGLCVK